MKIYMHWDMEGVSGIFARQQVWFWEDGVSPEVAQDGRELLIADVNAATRAALDAGADQVIVCDTHHGGDNVLQNGEVVDVAYLGRDFEPAQKSVW